MCPGHPDPRLFAQYSLRVDLGRHSRHLGCECGPLIGHEVDGAYRDKTVVIQSRRQDLGGGILTCLSTSTSHPRLESLSSCVGSPRATAVVTTEIDCTWSTKW
jgi:hypothetical protein